MPWRGIVIDPVFFPGTMDGDQLKFLSQKGMERVCYKKSFIRFVAMKRS